MRQALACALTGMLAIASAASSARADQPATFDIHGTFDVLYLGTETNGPGTLPPEAAVFASGGPLAPLTPYELFAAVPFVSGDAWQSQGLIDLGWHPRKFSLGVRIGATDVSGGVTDVVYWGEPLQPALNVHLGSSVLPYAIVFPTAFAHDNASAARAEVLQANFATTDGRWSARLGWLDLKRTNAFILAMPAAPSAIPSTAVVIPESLSDGPPTLDGWQTAPATLPLRGIDVAYHVGSTSVEAADVHLPSLPGTPVRASTLIYSHNLGGGHDWSVQFADASSSGQPITTPTLNGFNPSVTINYQGVIASSTLFGQHETIAGAHLDSALTKWLDGVADFGVCWNVDAFPTEARRSTGSYVRAGLLASIKDQKVGLNWYRFDPRYGSIVLPDGVPENQWNIGFSWPGQWLKSTYQIVDNSHGGANRQGPEATATLKSGKFEERASFGDFQQIEPYDAGHGLQPGWVEGFFLPQLSPGTATLGSFKRFASWTAWHASFGDLSYDFVDDDLHRDARLGIAIDAVSLDTPMSVVTASRSFGKALTAAVGWAKYDQRGSWVDGSVTNVDYGMSEVFGGVQAALPGRSQLMVAARRMTMRGFPSASGGPPPNFDGSLLLVEQRYSW